MSSGKGHHDLNEEVTEGKAAVENLINERLLYEETKDEL